MSQYEGEWQNGVCDCFNDCSTCVLAYFCPCYVFGKTAESVGESCCLCGLAFLVHPFHWFARLHVRERIRQKKGLRGTVGYDMLLLEFCGICTLCQEAQEVKDIQPLAMSRE